jgi:hypothetical protein
MRYAKDGAKLQPERAAPCPLGLGLLLLILAERVPAHGQGTVNFNNRVVGQTVTTVYANEPATPAIPIFGSTTSNFPPGNQNYTGPLLSGAGWYAQLWAAPDPNQPEDVLQPAMPLTTFRTGAAAGFFAGETATLANVPPDYPVATLQLRVWPTTYSNWDSAFKSSSTQTVPMGKSLPFNVTNIGGVYNVPPTMNALRSFSLGLGSTGGTYQSAPIIQIQPQNIAIDEGQTASFSVMSSSTCCAEYFQWRFKNSDMPGATNASIALPGVQSSANGAYSVWVTNTYGGTLSASATLTVIPPAPPSITSQPTSLGVPAGQSVVLNVSATGAVPLSFQWWSNNISLAWATSPQLFVANVPAASSNIYFVVITNRAGSITSSVAAITVTNPLAAGNSLGIISQPQNVAGQVGDTVSFGVVALGAQPLSYQWMINGLEIAGANDNTLTISHLQNVNYANYSVRVGNGYGSQTSAAASLLYPGAGGGYIYFNNRIPSSVITQVYGPDPANSNLVAVGNTPVDFPPGNQVYAGSLLAGSNFVAQLWAAPEANQPEAKLLPATPTTTFRTGAAAGFLASGVATFPNVPPDLYTATLQLRVWDSRNGSVSDWTKVLSDPTILRGSSPLISVSPVGGRNAPGPNLTGLQSFNIHAANLLGAKLDHPMLTKGGFEFVLNDQLGAAYEIQFANGIGAGWNHLTWVTNLYGKVYFQDPNTNSGNIRLYRAVRVP